MLPNYKCVKVFEQWACSGDWLITIATLTSQLGTNYGSLYTHNIETMYFILNYSSYIVSLFYIINQTIPLNT